MVHKWNIGGRFLQRFVMDNLTWGSIRAVKNIVDTMDRTAVEIYEARKKALETGGVLNGSGKDILTILSKIFCRFPFAFVHRYSLVQSNVESADEDKLPDHEILAQISWVSVTLSCATDLIHCQDLCSRRLGHHFKRSLPLPLAFSETPRSTGSLAKGNQGGKGDLW